MRHRNKGLTLIEVLFIMAVVAILAILAAVTVGAYLYAKYSNPDNTAAACGVQHTPRKSSIQ